MSPTTFARPAATAALLVTAMALAGCTDPGRTQRRQSGTAVAPRPAAQPAESSGGSAASAAPADRAGGETASTRPATFTGTLRGSAVAIGGETTGWRLEGDNQTGGLDVDVSRVTDRARALDGRRVTVTGSMTTRSWTERGKTQVLVAERLDEAPRQPTPPGPTTRGAGKGVTGSGGTR